MRARVLRSDVDFDGLGFDRHDGTLPRRLRPCARVLRAELFLKRLELREFFANPSVKTESIRAKYAEINELQTKLEDKMVDYLIRVRSLLTAEQVSQWCPELEIPAPFRHMFRGMEPMGPRPLRRPFNQEGWKEN